jgi:putative methanogenesis marker protein 17
MEIYIECNEAPGRDALKAMIEATVADLGVSRLIDEMRVSIDLETPLFYISVTRSPYVSAIRMSDLLDMNEEDGVVKMEMRNETYAPHLLRLLWERFPGRVNQIRRNILEVEAKEEEILALPVYEIGEAELEEMIHDLIHRMIPIGFRVIRKVEGEPSVYAYIASENGIW